MVNRFLIGIRVFLQLYGGETHSRNWEGKDDIN